MLFRLRFCLLETLKNKKGVLTLGNTIDHNYISPAIYPGNKPEKQLSLLHEFHSLEECVPKSDILGHNAPWTIAKLKEASGVDFKTIKFNDERVYRMLWDKSVIYEQLTPEQVKLFEEQFDRPGLNNGLPEFSTVFLGEVCSSIKPLTFADVVKINGITHGKGIWLNNSQKESLEKGKITDEEVFGCREQIFDFLKKGGIESTKAFYIVESLRKGKKLKQEELELVKDCNLNKEVIKNILQINYLFPESHRTTKRVR